MNAQEAMDAASVYLDLATAPFTLLGSRLLVIAGDRGLEVGVAEYERGFDECLVLDQLQVFNEHGDEVHVSRATPGWIEFGGVASLTFSGANALSFGYVPGADRRQWSLKFRMVSPSGAPIGTEWMPGLPSASTAKCTVTYGKIIRGAADPVEVVTIPLQRPEACVLIEIGSDGANLHSDHDENLASTLEVWREWFSCCPQVRDDLQNMAAFCWWVLGANTVELAGHDQATAVVPSKLGYVGLWQWDAYFIAAGLRHGAPSLARQQLELALRYVGDDGQLPDVVHDNGVLASSDDLPPRDRDSLRRAASHAADASVPLTKPPLAAWALRKIMESMNDPEDAWIREMIPIVQRSQQWWFDRSDLDGDGMPEYTHPYSSGLDDSPIFDGELPVQSPDLSAYLVVQDRALADLCDRFHDPRSAEFHRRRANSTMELLLRRWHSGAGLFRAYANGAPLSSCTAVSLIPLLTGSLPAPVATRLLSAFTDESEFATPFPVPTVARNDPNFSAERMWRGPVWVNINALLVEGLLASGFADESIELAERTLALVQNAGGPHEYFNPLTGAKAKTATTCFGWSAALFIDLAVHVSTH